METDTIKDLVRARYGAIAAAATACCVPTPAAAEAPVETSCCAPTEPAATSSCCGPAAPDEHEKARRMGYSDAELTALPDGANLGLGCGNPQAIADLRPGETVLDLGSGAGIDCFLAARAVGPSGRAIGVDMTHEMLAKARANASVMGLPNVEFRLGELEHLPVADGQVDVILSNCVINLVPDKAQVFQEAFRVLKPNGRLAISDVVNIAPLADDLAADPTLLCGCIAGAAPAAQIETWLRDAGFTAITITPKPESRELIATWAPGRGIENSVVSATIEARKP